MTPRTYAVQQLFHHALALGVSTLLFQPTLAPAAEQRQSKVGDQEMTEAVTVETVTLDQLFSHPRALLEAEVFPHTLQTATAILRAGHVHQQTLWRRNVFIKLLIQRGPHSKYRFLAPSSKLCQNWLHHWRGTLYLHAAVLWCCRWAVKGLGTDKTVEATELPSMHINMRCVQPWVEKKSFVLIPTILVLFVLVYEMWTVIKETNKKYSLWDDYYKLTAIQT